MTETRFANLALQGGGAHGAFTWGVLDRLLKELRFEIDGISATSAGAINAVVLAHGLTVGGRDGAINALANFWQQVAVISTWLGSNQRSIFRPSTHERGSRPIIVDPEPEEAKAQWEVRSATSAPTRLTKRPRPSPFARRPVRSPTNSAGIRTNYHRSHGGQQSCSSVWWQKTMSQ
jgi:predicted acylesterase/phospholipase RssA